MHKIFPQYIFTPFKLKIFSKNPDLVSRQSHLFYEQLVNIFFLFFSSHNAISET